LYRKIKIQQSPPFFYLQPLQITNFFLRKDKYNLGAGVGVGEEARRSWFPISGVGVAAQARAPGDGRLRCKKKKNRVCPGAKTPGCYIAFPKKYGQLSVITELVNFNNSFVEPCHLFDLTNKRHHCRQT